MKRHLKSEEALEAGGYIATCGNAARYRHPQGGVRKMHFKQAQRIVKSLEHFACSIKWPFADWYRKPLGGGE